MTARGMWRAVLALLLAAAIGLPLASCGKRGKLEPPPGAASDYPRKYPHE
jgi:predicted small lipoprotein YifL